VDKTQKTQLEILSTPLTEAQTASLVEATGMLGRRLVFERDKLKTELEQAKLEEPTWIVNDMGELGVEIHDRQFFLYKGRNIEYNKDPYHDKDDEAGPGDPIMYRIVGKREFGEVCYPIDWWDKRGHPNFSRRYTRKLKHYPGLSFGKPEDGDWKPIPPDDSNSEREERNPDESIG